MKHVTSPWIAQLKPKGEPHVLYENRTTDIAVVGAGIAGVATTFFLLKNTSKRIILVESGRVAHGATGHNGGQLVSYFERQFSELVESYGIDLAKEAQISINSAWDLLSEIFSVARLQTPIEIFQGYAGCQDIDQLLIHIKNNVYSKKAGIPNEPLIVSDDWEGVSAIPEEYIGFYSLVPHTQILEKLCTNDKRYIAALTSKKGVMNSALFCEELLDYLLVTYPDRLTLFEESHVDEVVLYEDHSELSARGYKITAEKIVLCTNGFEKFEIINTSGPDIDTKFHHLVKGAVGYMAGYLEDSLLEPAAISYLPKRSNTGNFEFDEEPYFYLTRRHYELEPNNKKMLTTLGGPESLMDDTNNYGREHPYPDEAQTVLDSFFHTAYKFAPKTEIQYLYRWHGLMGYTPDGIRLIGPEPINKRLLYNLGCNGVGLLPSIYGGKKIAQIINGEKLPESIFDPKNSRI